MRPLRSFFILLIFLACFTGLHYLLPEDQMFPPLNVFIPDVLQGFFRRSENPASSGQNVTFDTISVKPVQYADTVIPVDSSQNIAESVVVNPLQRFLDSLDYSMGQVRIIYYGDSQIEGDRFTSHIRHILQKRYSGHGPGLFLPIMPVMYTKSIVIKSSSNWRKYNYLSYKNKEISHNKLGPFMAICRYLPEGEITPDPVSAFINIKPSSFADSASSNYDILRLFYIISDGSVVFSVKADGKYICREALLRTGELSEISCKLNSARDVTLEFTGKVSPDIYGISIESERGVIVDNIPQRGSAGLEFTMVDSSNLAESFRKLSPDLFVLQYGLNIVRNVRDEYNYYQHGLERQISLLNKIAPSVPVLVVSVTDMASTDEGKVMSFRNIPAIIEAQKKASEETGAAFWDSYSAMGGDSSIIRWSEKKPPLAQKDLVHFTYIGADTLSDRLTSSLFILHEKDTLQQALPILPHDTLKAEISQKTDDIQTGKGEEGTVDFLLLSLFKYDPGNPFIFTSAAFWIFFLFVLAGYSIVFKHLKLRNAYLLLISLFFYYKAGGLFLFILIFVTVIDYTCGILISRSDRSGARRFFVIISIISNFGLLGYFKYTGFIVTSINELFGTHLMVYDMLSGLSNSILGTSFDISYIILPVGISFFTFQSLSYTFDVYRRKMAPVRNIIDFGFYVSFFPHLVAGPIVRASVFIPQLYHEFKLTRHEFSHALFMISKGLIKKMIISNFIAVNLVDRVFDAPSVYSGFENLTAIYGYGLQIYCDFSGYTDIAIGVALILGFRLPVNFNSPYKAKNITDFWKRWHISLSQWLKDYLYIPLGGNRKGRIRTQINLMITMLLGGLWHGASLRFIIWGGLHGSGLVINRIWESVTGGRILKGRIGNIIGILITFNFVSFCWIFFRAPDMDSIKIMFNQIVSAFSPGSYLTVLSAYFNVFLLMAVGFLIHFLPENVKESYRGLFIKIPLALQLTTVMLVAILLYQMRTTDVMPFIYFRF